MAKKYIPFYNIESAVGKNCANKSEDVMLVQFFLREVGKVPPFPLPPPQTQLQVNGVMSPVLDEWIWWFQNSVKKAGKAVTADGRIDPAQIRGGSIWGGQGTIAHLNKSYRNRFHAQHDALEKANGCPAPLAAKFSDESNPN